MARPSGKKSLDASVDVFAFGILMWQLLCGTVLYKGMSPSEIVRSVVRRGLRPTFPSWVPHDYRCEQYIRRTSCSTLRCA